MNRISRLAGLVVVAAMVVGCATATLLPDGRVLLVSLVAKIYDPTAGAVTVLGMPGGARATHTATLLLNGQILLVGGLTDNKPIDSAELFDPATGAFAPTGAPLEGRSFHTATLLADGRVLIVGGGELNLSGGDPVPPLATAELYDPATGTFTATGTLKQGRLVHTATLLADGRVLVVGGAALSETLATAEIYDPATGVFTETGPLAQARSIHTATLLADGHVLVIGGSPPSDSSSSGTSEPLKTTESYDPGSGTFAAATDLTEGRSGHTATLLQDGRLLVTGGMIPAETGLDSIATAELYDPASATFTATGSMTVKRSLHVAALLQDGRVLVVGPAALAPGETQVSDTLGSADTYDPATGTFTAVDVEKWAAPTPCPTKKDGTCKKS
jgi:hypothetical protein